MSVRALHYPQHGSLRRFGRIALYVVLVLPLLALLGFVLGLMVVVAPPMAWISVLGIAAAILLWVLPEIDLVSDRLFRVTFLIALPIQFMVPIYYAVFLPGLPWISLRRVTWFAMIILAGLMVATSMSARNRFNQVLTGDRLLSSMGLGFLVAMTLSVITSISWVDSLRDLSDTLLYWHMAFVGVVLFVRTERDLLIVFRVLLISAIVAGVACLVEYLKQSHIYIENLPAAILARLAEDYPLLLDNMSRDYLRNGNFRVNYIYLVSQSCGEALAMYLPFTLHFAVHGRTRWSKTIGIIAALLCTTAVLTSGARAAAISAAFAAPLFACFYVARQIKSRANSMLGGIGMVVVTLGVLAFITLFFASPRFQTIFTGGGEAEGSTDARRIQWELAQPSIINRPLTGHGLSTAANVVGYILPNGTPSVDSTVISSLVEVGVPGALFFFGMVWFGAWLMFKLYLSDRRELTLPALSIGCALVTYGVNRLSLSQRENNFFFYILLALALIILHWARSSEPLKGPVREGAGDFKPEARAPAQL